MSSSKFHVALIAAMLPSLLLPAQDRSAPMPPEGPTGGGNRLTYLDDPANPYFPGLHMARLTTPQWIGDEGVQAAIVLAIDDMADAEKYERFLRPILERLKQIDGRAPVSIMTTSIDPRTPRLQEWLGEGVSIETHTDRHPCPCLQGGSLAEAKATFDRCVDALSQIPNMQPVAYRMPCCDSMNSVSPRFFREVFSRTTPAGRFLTMDSSVFMLYTSDDPDLPRDLVVDGDGRQRYGKYLPADRLMVNYVRDYPYPFVVGRLCWEIPCLMPSDWDAQHANGKCSPLTVSDLKAAVDATVLKQGIFSLCFHPHGWLAGEQVIELIDHAVTKHGSKVKFLTFPEVQQRLDRNLLGGHPLRAEDGADNGVRVLDVNADGYLDAVIGNSSARQTRIWQPATGRWTTTDLPIELVSRGEGAPIDGGVRFGVLRGDGAASLLVRSESAAGVWHFDGSAWAADPLGLDGVEIEGPVFTSRGGVDQGVRLRDLDRDGICELIVGGAAGQAVFSRGEQGWRKLPFSLPAGVHVADRQGRDAGLRFVDLDRDGHDDLVFSDAGRCAAYAFESMDEGWSRKMFDAPRRGEEGELPMIVRADGTDNGVWFSYGHMWVQNEDTGGWLPDHVDRRSFAALLGISPPASEEKSVLKRELR